MKNLNPIAKPHIDFLVAIRDARKTSGGINHKAVITGEHAAIVAQYNAFSQLLQQRKLASITASARLKPISISLRGCYTGKSAGIKSLKSAIKDAQPKRRLKFCPMCGVSRPSTYDHYLPGIRFPEFSVHPLNLVPCCSICNSTKDDDFLNQAGTLQYLHLYSDLIPTTPFLVVQLQSRPPAKAPGAAFSISRPSGFNLVAWALIERHYERLHLLERYSEDANDEIEEILESCAVHLSNGGKSARKFLRTFATQRAALYGDSDWRVVLTRELMLWTKLKATVEALDLE